MKTIIPVIGILLVVSCTSEENASIFTGDKQTYCVEIPNGKKNANKEEYVVHGDMGNYASFMSKSDSEIGISSSRYYPLGEETVTAFYSPSDVTDTKSHINDEFAYKIRINEKAVFSSTTKSEPGSIKEMFGGPVSFSFSEDNLQTKVAHGIVNLYVPKIVRINFPEVVSEDNRYPLCYYKDFVVRWNEDSANKDGIIVFVKWSGIMVFGEDYSSSYIYHIIRVPDSGSTVLDETMFEGIPDAAYCSLGLLRGVSENIEFNDETIKVLAESHDILDFVLVRNIVSNEDV